MALTNSPRTKKGLESKERIFNKSLELFKTKGYEQTTLTDICSEANIANGTFYHYYKSKQDICVEYIKRENVHLFAYYKSMNVSSYAKALCELFEMLFESSNAIGQEFYNTVFIAELKSMQQIFHLTEENSLYNIVFECIQKGQKSNEFSNEFSANYVTDLFMGLITHQFFKWSSSDKKYNIKEGLMPNLKMLIDSISQK